MFFSRIVVTALLLSTTLANAAEVPFLQNHDAGLGWVMSARRSGSVSGSGGGGGGGGGGGPITSSLAVYPGCTAPPSAPDSYASSKDWYFDVANGHPPSYYDNLGVPQSEWGDVNHPFDNPNQIWGQGSPGWGINTYPIRNNNLNTLALFGFYRTPTNFVVRDSADFGNPQTSDPNHYRLWPGDTVYLRGDSAGDSFGQFSTNPQGPSVAQSNLNVDGNGNTKWVWIKADPNYPMPIFSDPGSTVVLVPDTQGVILQGIGIKTAYDWTALTTAGLTGLPTQGSPQGSGGPTGFANNNVSFVPLTGGHGSGATGTVTFNTLGQVQSFALKSGGTGYQAGDVLGVAANSGEPSSHDPNGVGSLTGFSVHVQYPNTAQAFNLIGMDTGEVPTTNLVSNTTFAGTTITLNTDEVGTTKTFTFGGGTNPIPFPGTQSYLLDALLNAEYTLSHDPAITPLYNISTFESSFLTTWKTLTAITSIPSNGNTFTFGYDGSTWTWVTSGATGNQINIPAEATLTTSIQAATAALTTAYGSSLTLSSVTSGSTGVSWTAKTAANQDVWGPAVPATAAPDLPAANSTFTYHGVSTNDVWTFVASGATGHQVNIGASVGDTILNIQSALASAYPGTTVAQPFMGNGGLDFSAVKPGLDGLLLMASNYPYQSANVDGTAPVPFMYLNNTSVGLIVSGGTKGIVGVNSAGNYISTGANVTPSLGSAGSADFTSGNSLTFDGIVYHWWNGTGTAPSNPIDLGGNTNASLANAVVVVNATDKTLQVPATGGEIGDTKDVILDNINIGSWGVGHTFNAYTSDYPNTGSLKIDTTTGSHGGWAHDEWNIMDWLTTPYFVSIQINGSRDSANAGPQPVIGTSCVALTNSYSHHVPTISPLEAYDVLLQNVFINYNSDGDSYDNYVSHDIEYNNVWAVNPLNPLHGIHPDGIQFGAGGQFTLSQSTFLWSNISVLNSHFIGGTDPMLGDSVGHPELFTTGWDNVSYPLIDQQTGLNDTADRLSNMRVANNEFATDNIDVYLPYAQNSVIVNNSILNHGGFPAESNGGLTIGTFLTNVGVTQANNVIENNLMVGMGYGSSGSVACADTSNIIKNNITISTYVDGGLYGLVGGGSLCNRASPPDRGTVGSSPPASLFGTGTFVSVVSTQPTDGQILSGIDGTTYTWKNSPSGATQIQIGANLAASLVNAGTTIMAHDTNIFARSNPVSSGLLWGFLTTSEEDGGVVYDGGDPVAGGLVSAWSPANNEIANTSTLNPAPPGYPSAPTGGLVGTGTNAGGYAPSTNIDGNAWPTASPNIGAY